MEWVVLGILAVLLAWFIIVYNRLVTLRQVTSQAWSDVDVQLKQRHDLIPNLVETVKGYAAHEKETLDAVIRARNAAVTAQAQGPAAAGPAEGALGAALGRLFALSEAYPDLKANQNFIALQSELSDIENKIAAARRFYNSAVAEYNAMTESVPAVFFAKALGFQQRGFFELPEAERSAVQAPPQVRFS
jgi:LemA protein